MVEELEPYLENEVKAIAQDAGILSRSTGRTSYRWSVSCPPGKSPRHLWKLTGGSRLSTLLPVDKYGKRLTLFCPSGRRPCAPAAPTGLPIMPLIWLWKLRRRPASSRSGLGISAAMLWALTLRSMPTYVHLHGRGFDLANGFAKVIDAPVVAHLGDSTFFHSGHRSDDQCRL